MRAPLFVPSTIIWPAAALAFTLSLAATGAPAQQYPAKPIRIIVPVTAGGPTDTIARIIGQKLTEAWGYAVVIDNRPGAGGTIGDAVAAKAPPDGYTVAFVGMHFIIAPMLHSNAGYDTIRDFAPVVDKLNREIVRIVHTPGMKEQLIIQGFDPVGDTPDEFARYLRAEVTKWAKVIKETGLRAE